MFGTVLAWDLMNSYVTWLSHMWPTWLVLHGVHGTLCSFATLQGCNVWSESNLRIGNAGGNDCTSVYPSVVPKYTREEFWSFLYYNRVCVKTLTHTHKHTHSVTGECKQAHAHTHTHTVRHERSQKDSCLCNETHRRKTKLVMFGLFWLPRTNCAQFMCQISINMWFYFHFLGRFLQNPAPKRSQGRK